MATRFRLYFERKEVVSNGEGKKHTNTHRERAATSTAAAAVAADAAKTEAAIVHKVHLEKIFIRPRQGWHRLSKQCSHN